MTQSRLMLVVLLLGMGLLGAFYGVYAQDGRSPWPPRPVAPPEAEESEVTSGQLKAPFKTPQKNSQQTVQQTPPPPIFPTGNAAKGKAEEPPPPLPTPTPTPTPTQTPESAPPPPPPITPPIITQPVDIPPDAMPDPVFPPIKQISEPSGPPKEKITEPKTEVKPEPKIAPLPPADPIVPGPLVIPSPTEQVKPKVADPVQTPVPEPVDKTPAFRILKVMRRPGDLGNSGPSLLPDVGGNESPVAQSGTGNLGPVLLATQTPRVTLEKIGAGQLKPGERQQITIIVRNHGAVPARNVRIDDELPVSLKIVTADPQPALQTDKGLTWLLPVLLAGETQKIRFDVQASDAVTLAGTTTLTVSSPGQGHTANRLTTGPLGLKVIGPAAGVAVGQTAAIEIQFANRTNQAMKGLVLRVNLPAGLTHPMGSAIEGDVGELAAGADRGQKLTLTAKLPGRQVVEVEMTNGNGDKATARTEIAVLAGANSALDVRQRPMAQVQLKREGEIKIDVCNTQAKALKNVMVMDTLPEGLEFAAASDRGLYQHDTRIAHWLIDDLPVGQTKTLTLKVRGKSAGEFDNEVLVRTEARVESKSSGKVRVVGQANLAVTVSNRAAALEVGRPTVYEIRVVNRGTGVATGIEVQAEVPAGMAAGNCKGPTTFQLDGQRVVFGTLARLQPQEEVVFQVGALAQAQGTMNFLAHVSSQQDPTPITREKRTVVYRD